MDALFAELNDLYASGAGVLGTYVSGSAAKGPDAMTRWSDVDFYVLTEDYHGFLERIHGATKVEIRWRTESEIELDLARNGFFIYQLMEARPLRDSDGRVRALIDDATARFQNYKTPPTVYRDLQFRLAEARNKILSAATIPPTCRADTCLNKAAYLSSVYVPLLMEGVYAICNKPAAPPAVAWRWLDQLGDLSEAGRNQLRDMMSAPLRERIEMTQQHLNNLHGAVTARLRG